MVYKIVTSSTKNQMSGLVIRTPSSKLGGVGLNPISVDFLSFSLLISFKSGV